MFFFFFFHFIELWVNYIGTDIYVACISQFLFCKCFSPFNYFLALKNYEDSGLTGFLKLFNPGQQCHT